jgi:hypothetical protein
VDMIFIAGWCRFSRAMSQSAPNKWLW